MYDEHSFHVGFLIFKIFIFLCFSDLLYCIVLSRYDCIAIINMLVLIFLFIFIYIYLQIFITSKAFENGKFEYERKDQRIRTS